MILHNIVVKEVIEMFGNPNGLETAVKITGIALEEAESRFSEVPSLNLVKILKNIYLTPVYRHAFGVIGRIEGRIKHRKTYGTPLHLLEDPETYIPSSTDQTAILRVLEKRMESQPSYAK